MSFLKRRPITGMLLLSEQRASRGPAGYLLKEHCAKEKLYLSDTRTLSTNYAVHFTLQRTYQLVTAHSPNRQIKNKDVHCNSLIVNFHTSDNRQPLNMVFRFMVLFAHQMQHFGCSSAFCLHDNSRPAPLKRQMFENSCRSVIF